MTARRVPRAPIPVAFALAVLATLAPEQAAAQTVTTLLSNTGQTANTSSNLARATAFTTGTGTYTLSSVGITLGLQSDTPTPVVQIFEGASPRPVTLVATMTNPGTIVDNAVNIFTAPANTTLSASTTYWLVTSNSASVFSTGLRVATNTNTNTDSGTAAGWSIGNALFKTDLRVTSWSTSSSRHRFQIRGTQESTPNNPPTVANAIPDQSATVGTAFSYVFPTNTFSDADSDALSYTATKADGTTLPTWLSFADSTRTFSGTPQAADAGTVSVKVTASDGKAGSDSDEFDIMVTAAANTPPTAADGAVTTLEDTPYTFAAADFNFSDADTGDTLASVIITAGPMAGSITVDGVTITAADRPKTVSKADIDAGKLKFVPPLNAAGPSRFNFKVNDGTDDSAVAEMRVTTNAVNDPPTVANTIPDQSATVGTAFSYVFPANTFSDADSDTLSYAATKADGMALPTWLSFADGTRTFSGTPQAADTATVSVKVAASDGKGGSDSDEFDITVAATAPGAPTSLTAAASGTTTINLSWTAPASTGGSAITGYKIEVSSDGGSSFTDQLANTNTTTTTYAHTGLAAGTTRHYRVSAINGTGTGTPSNVDSATTGTATTVPGAPTSLTATASGTTTINLSWTAPASTGGSAITGYKIEISSDGGSSFTDQVANNATTTYTHTGLAAGTTRHYRVSAINGTGTGPISNTAFATTAAVGRTNLLLDFGTGSDSDPIKVFESRDTQHRFVLSLRTRPDAAPDGNPQQPVTIPLLVTHMGGATTEDYEGLPASVTFGVGESEAAFDMHAFQDRMIEPGEGLRIDFGALPAGIVKGDWGPYETVEFVDGLVPIRATVEGTALVLTYDKVLSSTSSPSASDFTVRVAAQVVTVDAVSVGGSLVTLTLATAVQPGQTVTVAYEQGYNLYDMVGNQAQPFDDWRVTNITGGDGTTTVPGAPTGLTATADGETEIDLSWAAPASNGGSAITGYKIEVSSDGGTNWTDRVANTGNANTTYSHTGLAGGTMRHYRVSAINTNGTGDPSNVANATTASGGGGGDPPGSGGPPGGRGGPTATLPGAPESLVATAGDGSVVFEWTAPADDGGSPVTGYEYRYAEGSSVPENTPWQSAGLSLERTVADLTNGQPYVFEVRALNSAGGGAAAKTVSTPLGVPSVPVSLVATAGDGSVVFEWTAPADDGGSPVTGYEYRYAEGSSVPENTPWQSAGLSLERTVADLTNGQPYVFEVRALNSAGGGAAAKTVSTPLGVPSVLASLTATAGDGSVVFEWTAPADDGGSPVTGYEYRYAEGDGVPDGTPWQDAGTELSATVTGLDNETPHAFEVRARNNAGPGGAAMATATPIRLEAELFSSAAVAEEGEPLVIGLRRSGGVAHAAHGYIGVTDSAVPGAAATEEGRDDGLGRHRLEFAAGAAEATVAVRPAFDGERGEGRVITATLESVEVEIGGAARAYELGTVELALPVTDADAVLSVADARADAESAQLVFAVSLDRTRDVPVRVDYATEDYTARAGEDYTAVSGTLVIEAGGREAAVEVPVPPAPHLTGERTLVLRLSNARNARIVDGEAAGVIARESALAQAWLARFGRAASDHTAQAIARRLEAGRRETQVTVAGRRLDGLVAGLRSGGMPLGDFRLGGMPLGGRAPGNAGLGSAASGILTRAAGPGIRGLAAERQYSGGTDRRSVEEGGFRPALPDFGVRIPAMEEALLGSSFYVEGGAEQDEGGGRSWAVWGDVAATHFEGDASGLALQGDVVTGTVGLDRQWRTLLVGLALSRSSGEGTYGTGAGTVTSTLTSAHPYVRVRLGERAQLWGATGWGRGGLELTPARGGGTEADLSNSMAALGGRAVLRRANPTASSFDIAMRSDLLWTTTSSADTAALPEATGTASRGRLLLESGARIYGLGGVLRPQVEGGLRYDGGDAETGQGFEVGGGLGWARGALTLEVNGRMLVAHADESYEEWGYGGSLVYEPGNDNLGLQMRIGAAAGAMASSVQNLWGVENARGLVRPDGTVPEQRLDAEVGYGLGGRMLWYPYVAADATGQRRFGLRLGAGRTLGAGLEIGRRETAGHGPEDALLLRGEMRF